MILQHFILAALAGKGLILRLADARAITLRQDIDFHVSPVFVTYKEGAPLMRAIDDYTFGGPNHPAKKDFLAKTWLPICNPTAGDLCAALTNAALCNPGRALYACRVDISKAYHRVRTDPRDVPLMALAFRDGDVELVYFPLTNEFGSEDSNYRYAVPAAVLIAPRLVADFRTHGCYLSSVYTDDNWHFDDLLGCLTFIGAITHDARALGSDAVEDRKTLLQPQLPLHGYAMDCTALTIGITERIFMRFLDALCTAVPREPRHGDRVPLQAMQQLASYAIRCASLMPLMRAHSKGFSWNTRRRFASGASVSLTLRAVQDIWRWRYALTSALSLPNLLVVPISVPLLYRLLPGETRVDLADRQAALATSVGFADACTNGNGLGGYIPDVGYFSTAILLLTTYVRDDDCLAEIDINPLEFLAILLLAHIMVDTYISRYPLPMLQPHAHFHIWSDNASSVSWATRATASHPLHIFITQELARLQATKNCVFTFGSIAGVDNIHADAASRHFKCPNGPALRLELDKLGQLPVSSQLLTAAVYASKTLSICT